MGDWLMFVLVGLAAGWLATRIMKHRELDLVGNLLLGVIGSALGGFVFRLLGIVAYQLPGQIICATLGSMALIWLVRYFNKR